MARAFWFAAGLLGFGILGCALNAVPGSAQSPDPSGGGRLSQSNAKIMKLSAEIEAGNQVIKSFADVSAKFKVFSERVLALDAECMKLGVQVDRQMAQGLPDVYLQRSREELRTCDQHTRAGRKALAMAEVELEKLHYNVRMIEAAITDAEQIKGNAEQQRQIEIKLAKIRSETTSGLHLSFEREKLDLDSSLKSATETMKKFEAMPR